MLTSRTAVLALLLNVVVVLPLLPHDPAAAQDDHEDPFAVSGLSEPQYEEFITEVLEVETDHGTLYGEVIRPVVPEGVTVPVILTYSPYNVIGQAVTANGSIADDATTAYFAPRGYARAVFDVVGTRNSSGCYDYGGLGERQTGAALVDHLGTREWSNGRVGMIGGSYDGTTQFAAAIEQPEHLVTIVPQVAIDRWYEGSYDGTTQFAAAIERPAHLAAIIPQVAIDRWYDYAFGGGIRYFLNNESPTDEGFDTPLAFDFGFGFLPPVDPGRPSPELTAEALAGRFNPCERILHTQRAYEFDPVYDEFWEERDYRRHADRITAPVLIEGGWLDHNVKHWNSTRMFMALPQNLPRHLVMGQWAHAANQHDDAQDLRHAWFDRWLLDLDTGVEHLPLVDTQMGGTDARSAEADWPPPTTAQAVLPLLAAGVGRGTASPEGSTSTGLNLVGDGEPTWSEPPALATTEEEMFAADTSLRGTYLHYRGQPLPEAVRISGSPLLQLEVTTEGTSTHVTPVLYEQRADGSTAVITRGFLNARNREGLDVSRDVVAGQPYTVIIELWDVDHTVAEGSHLGLALASGNADWVLPDDDVQGANTLTGPSALTVPVSGGHQALGIQPPAVVDRLAGAGRVQTAVEVSAATFTTAETVVVATADDYPDALAAGPLAAALEAPLLLSGRAGLDGDTAAEVQRLDASRAVLAGGTAALSARVAEDLEALGLTVDRFAGADRFGTAAAIADQVIALAGTGEVVPFVVEGEHTDPARGWPDAVSVGGLAAFTGQPILLVNAHRLPTATAQAIDRLDAAAATVVGGEAAVSDDVVTQLEASGVAVTRVAGQTRYATSSLVHAAMVDAGMDAGVLWLATGGNWPDALTAGPAVAGGGQSLALIDGDDLDASPETRDLLRSPVDQVRLLGGVAAVSDVVVAQIRQRLAG